MRVLEMNQVRKSFGELDVLKGISLAVDQGEVVSIIGPSGSGKSTLLRCATMLETMEEGDLCYLGEYAAKCDKDGKSVYAPARELRRIQRHFGLVFQNFNLFPHFSVMKNITDAPLLVQRRPRDEVFEEGRELLRKMGLSDKENAYPCELSGGQQQRVSIARALAMKPEILFFDEPTSALDPELTLEILKVLRELAEEHMTMVIVTHEMNFARDVSGRMIFMEGGNIVEETTPEKLFSSENARTREFLGRYHDLG